MRRQSIFLLCGILWGCTFIFTGCEQEMINDQLDTYSLESKEAQYVYFDEAGNMKTLEVNGPMVTFKKNGREQTVDVSEANLRNEETLVSRTITQVTGSLQNDFRGRLTVSYINGRGRVFWKLREDVTFWGEIECIRHIRDQIVLDIRITRSTASDPFAVGQKVVTTVRDNGTPNAKLGIYDQIAKVMLIYARPNECMNPFLPDVNDLLGFDNSTGNIHTK